MRFSKKDLLGLEELSADGFQLPICLQGIQEVLKENLVAGNDLAQYQLRHQQAARMFLKELDGRLSSPFPGFLEATP